MNSLERFLMRRIYEPGDHHPGWDKFVYDDEHLHYPILQTLCEGSEAFRANLLQLTGPAPTLQVGYKPHGGLFDLLFDVAGSMYYCEVKVWAALSENQFVRQTAYLDQVNAKGIYVLLAKAAHAWPSASVVQRSEGRSHVVTLRDLRDILSGLETGLPIEVTEVARAYDSVLESLNARWPSPDQG
jgi:hypothetical protein